MANNVRIRNMNYQEGLQEYMECNRQLAGAMNSVNTNLTSMFEGLEVSMIDLASRLEDVYAEAQRPVQHMVPDPENPGFRIPAPRPWPKDDEEQLENSMFKDVPPEIKAAAERAGIGIEDLCDLALKFVDKRNEAKQSRRDAKYKRLVLKKEKALELAALEIDYKLRREVDAKVSDIRWSALTSFAGNINTVTTAAVKWGSLAAGASFIAYSITNIFVG